MRTGLASVLCGILLTLGIGCDAVQTSAPGPRGGRGAGETDEAVDEVNAGGDDVLVPQQGEDIAPAAGPATSCTESDLALCFTFEGTTDDQSATALKASEAANLAFVPGREGQAIAFGPTSALRFAPHPVFDLPAAGASIEAWIKRTATGADAVVLDDDARFSLTIDAGGHVWCKSSKGVVTGATFVAVDQWVHVACVIENGAMRAYVGGVVDAVGAGGIDPSPTSTAAIGGNAPSGEPFVGAIDSLRVFRSARTAEQIATAAGRATVKP